MRKLLVFQHVPFEILGTLDPLFRNAGFRIRYVNFGRHQDAEPRLQGYGGLIVLGGPMNVDEDDRYPHLATEVRLLREAMEREMPILGICLGAQLIAKALGARVEPNGRNEIGWYEVSPTEEGLRDPLFTHFRPAEHVFQWHGDTFDIPPGAAFLATSTGCSNQAFRFGDKVYALQFHLEVDEALIERWLRVPANRQALESLPDGLTPDRIREETRRHIGSLKTLSDRVFGEFIKLFRLPEKRRVLPSR